jgi:hypothetical protein
MERKRGEPSTYNGFGDLLTPVSELYLSNNTVGAHLDLICDSCRFFPSRYGTYHNWATDSVNVKRYSHPAQLLNLQFLNLAPGEFRYFLRIEKHRDPYLIFRGMKK